MGDPERGYTIVRTVGFTRKIVWEAWTNPEDFAVWFGTEAVAMQDVSLDVRVGGRWRGRMHLPDGSTKDWHGVYRAVERPRHLVMDLSDEPGDVFETYTVTLEKAGGGTTRMTVRQSGGHLTDAEYEQAKAGTERFLDSMTARLPAIKSRHEA